MIRSIKKMFKSNYLFTLGVVICLAWILRRFWRRLLRPMTPLPRI